MPNMNNISEDLRSLAIALLDDDHGISEKAWNLLYSLLVETGNDDIAKLVDSTDGRFYLPLFE